MKGRWVNSLGYFAGQVLEREYNFLRRFFLPTLESMVA